MPKINIENAEKGMVIAEDVIGPNGQSLLSEGIELTDKHIRNKGDADLQKNGPKNEKNN